MALTTDISLQLVLALTKALDLSVSPEARANVKKAIALATGTGANQADKYWPDQRTILASATDTLDLNGGGLIDPLGDAFAPARIKVVYVFAAAANTNNVNVVRPAANGVPLFLAAGDGIAVRPGGVFLWVAPDATGVAVTAGTGDLIDLVNSGGGSSVTYDIVIVGASA
jgi:hypothetical protein